MKISKSSWQAEIVAPPSCGTFSERGLFHCPCLFLRTFRHLLDMLPCTVDFTCSAGSSTLRRHQDTTSKTFSRRRMKSTTWTWTTFRSVHKPTMYPGTKKRWKKMELQVFLHLPIFCSVRLARIWRPSSPWLSDGWPLRDPVVRGLRHLRRGG